MTLLRQRALHVLLGLALGGVFVYASLDKIANPRDFARIIYHYQVLGPNPALGFIPANTLAVVLPWLELIAGLLLITGLFRQEAAAITALLLMAFIVAVGYALIHDIDIENCGCFSVTGAGRQAGMKLLLGDLVLLAAALLLAGVKPGVRSPARDATVVA